MAAPDTLYRSSAGFLARFRANRAGNTMAIIAAGMFPLAGFAGAAIDMARLYVVRTRLQQACDAGVLAGRKFMTGGTLDSTSRERAQQFFRNNFTSSWFRTTNVVFTPADTGDGQVRGTASVSVPMAVMGMFGFRARALNVSCEARFDVPDADIMFVLDTTGSMACTPARSTSSCQSYAGSVTAVQVGNVWAVPEESGSRIAGLKLAVLDFYDTVANAKDPSTRIRYGFVPYTSTVNVGRLLPSSYMVTDTWTYQSRRMNGEQTTGSWTTGPSIARMAQADCTAYRLRSPATGYPATLTYGHSWSSATGSNAPGVCSTRQQSLTPIWRYEPVDHDISGYVQGNAVPDPTKLGVTSPVWAGCIEERQTSALTTFGDPLPADLDIDLIPSSRATRWRPMWPQVMYNRSNNAPQDRTDTSADGSLDWRATTANNRGGFNTCVKQAQRLAELTRAQVSNYVNASDFTPHGGTYHDVGMIWGARFLSPTGPFAADTAARVNGDPPNRHLIFMTDGDMAPNLDIYGLYGYERRDQRVLGGAASSELTDRHNARFSAICEAAKSKGITVWVIAFSQSMTTRLEQCASPGKAYYAANTTQLRDAFREIASLIAELRLTK